MLRMQSVSTYYGRVQALKNVSLHVNEGEIVTLIGANGAGKTTTLNTISGLIPCAKGEILFKEKKISNAPPDRIVKMGICQVPEGRQIFGSLKVMDNLFLGAYLRYRRDHREDIDSDISYVFSLFPVLEKKVDQLAGTLSGGEQQMLAIGRALMAHPKLLLLDEPSVGLAPILTRSIFESLKELRERGTTILLVEQNAKQSLAIADRGYVLETGRVVLQGDAKELLENKEVRRAYLGREYKEVWE